MTRAQTRAVIAVEVFVEEDQVAPVRILLKLPRAPVNRAAALIVSLEDGGEPARDLLGHLVQMHLPPGAGRTFDREFIAVIDVVLQQRPQDQPVHRHPDRPPPVGIAAEHPGVRFRRQVGHAILLAAYPEHVRMVDVVARERTDAIGTQELFLVEHRRKHPAQLALVEDRAQHPA